MERKREIESEINSTAFRLATLRSERFRVTALLIVLAVLAVLIVLRGAVSLAEGQRGEAWPFAALLAITAVYEFVWLRFINNAIASARALSKPVWAASLFIESLLPTAALVLQTRTTLIGPQHTLTSPPVLTYFLFIILSTLHIDPGLSRLCGLFSAAGYSAVAAYVFATFPESVAEGRLLAYSTSAGYAFLLLTAGFAAGAVAREIRLHVVAALHEAENRARIAALEHDLNTARSIQQGLLPKAPPKVEGYDIAGWNQPADETGGDYFDWQHLADGRLAVTVADVTGHGIGPALCMAACRAYARAGFTTEKDPRCFLERLNQLLHEDLPPEKFVTLVAGVLNPADATLQLISAGHGPLLFYSSREGLIRAHDAQGPPLGLIPRLRYGAPHTLTFAPGDILVLVTDGFIEWANLSDEDFGQERLMAVVKAYRHLPSADIISKLRSAVAMFAGPVPQADDLTALVIKRL